MRYFRGLTISLGLHILIAFLLAMGPQDSFEPRLKTRQNFVELLEKPELPRRPRQRPRNAEKKQIVRSVDIPEELLTNEKKKTDFASEEDRYVLEEQRARLIDQSKNRGGGVRPSRNPKSTKGNTARKKLDFTPESALERTQREMAEQFKDGEVRIGGFDGSEDASESGKKLDPFHNMAGVEPGLSTFGEVVPDTIKFGDFTALNTDRHLFYSFYSRMEEKIRGRWVAYARAVVYNSPAEFHRPGGKSVWTTKLEVILDSEGRFERAVLMEPSGSPALDSAPVQAFKEAYQFPNPPKEMIGKDGKIHISYAFSVNVTATRYAER